MQDESLRACLRQRGLNYIEQNNWTVKMHEYLELVDKLLQPKGKAASLQPVKQTVPSPDPTSVI
jgi:hypothetical protein